MYFNYVVKLNIRNLYASSSSVYDDNKLKIKMKAWKVKLMPVSRWALWIGKITE